MRKFQIIFGLAFAASALSCGGAPEVSTSNSNLASSVETVNKRQTANDNAPAVGASRDLGVASSHGDASKPSAPDSEENPPLKTPELDEKIEMAVERANSPRASAAEKKAAADAYFERANYFRDAGNPRLYKFALADYRRGLRLDPSNREARARMDEIVMIYESMGKPVPQLGVEP